MPAYMDLMRLSDGVVEIRLMRSGRGKLMSREALPSVCPLTRQIELQHMDGPWSYGSSSSVNDVVPRHSRCSGDNLTYAMEQRTTA